MGNNGCQQYLVRHRNYCGRDSGMNQPDDFRPDALVSDDHAGVSLGLLLDFLGSEQGCGYCEMPMEPGSAVYRSGAERLWLDVEFDAPRESLVSFASIWLLRLD